MSEITCKIDLNVHDELKPVRAFIDRVQGIAEADSGDCHIDLTKCQYLAPPTATKVGQSMWKRILAVFGTNIGRERSLG